MDKSCWSLLFACLALVAVILGASAYACAPNVSAPPLHGTANLESGFTPDPWAQTLQAGGDGQISEELASGCRGYIDFSAPDVDLNYEAGGMFSLYIYAQSESDTTLVVNGPDGSWYCDDDSGKGLDPVVTFDNPESGNYNIWVGVHDGSGLQPATLKISELDPR